MDIINYLWFVPSVLLFILAIFVSLEAFSKKSYKDKGTPYFKQTFFLLLIAFICVGIDKYFLASFLKNINIGEQISNLLRFLLFPFLAYLIAIFLGESKKETITLEHIRKRRTKR